MASVVLCVGDITVDLALPVASPPRRGDEIFVDEGILGVGGSAANTASVLNRIGITAGVLGAVGTDPFGEKALARLRERGVDTSAVSILPDQLTGLIVIMVDREGERTMIGVRGANRHFPGHTDWTADWLHVSGYALVGGPQRHAALEAMAGARHRSVPISVDVPSGIAAALGEELIGVVAGTNLVSLGYRSLGLVAPRTGVEALLEAGVQRVAVTAGAGPVRFVSGGSAFEVTPPPVVAIDTTGAGDSFIAGLIGALLAGEDPLVTATTGVLLGTAAVLNPGIDGPGWDEALERVINRDWPDVTADVVAAAGRVLGR